MIGIVADWMTVRVELVSGGGADVDPAPGRVFLVGPNHTFGELANAINVHFARWDLSHLHEFRLEDGRRIGFPDPDGRDTLDQEQLRVTSVVGKGDEFEFVFDFGDDWTHRCRIEEVDIDPVDLYGEAPALPRPIWGWGSIPDQYGREAEERRW
jgi:Plasmid pRiA4b ORF-3-like protein